MKNWEEDGEYMEEMGKRAGSFRPILHTSNSYNDRRREIEESLPEGSSLSFGSRQADSLSMSTGMTPNSYNIGGGGRAMYHTFRPYLPDIETPDRQTYPENRLMANRYWRMFHKLDPIFGNAIDMYADMLVSDFDIEIKEDNSKEIKDTEELMLEKMYFLERLKHMVKEYLVIGEVVPHLFFDDSLNIWTYLALHNPDFIEIKDSYLINSDPVILFVPDEHTRELIGDNTPESIEIRRKLPADFVSKIMARQKIRLSPVNCSFIARKLHMYEDRGTSIASRMWRIFMVEDAVYKSTIATYRRHASPIKCLKLGDPATHWIPAPGVEAKLLEMLTRAEIDPNSWLIWNYGINFEAWGTTDRAISIKSEHDTIEKVKLLALGLSKGFMTGEVSYASVKQGLQVFLRRLLSLRQFFENIWINPKLFRPISIINQWKKPGKSEVNHQYRIKRTSKEIEQENMYIIPEIKWHNNLDPKVDSDLLNALANLEKLGIKVSKGTKSASLGIDWKSELRQHLEEFKEEKEIEKNTLGETMSQEYEKQQSSAKPPGGAGGGDKPPAAIKPGTTPAKDKSNPPGSAPDTKGPLADKPESPGAMGID